MWCVSHAGHILLPNDGSAPVGLPEFSQGDPHRSLHGQVAHKLAFIKDHVMRPFRDLLEKNNDADGGAAASGAAAATAASPRRRDGSPASKPSLSAASSPGGGGVPVPDLNLIFIGHSIGCWMICQLLKTMNPEMKKKVLKAYLLFPTIGEAGEL